MRRLAMLLLLLAFLVIGIPAFVVRGCQGTFQVRRSTMKTPTAPRLDITVFDHQKRATVNMTLEDYVKGAVAAEMPASFHMEALKAQAVAARTFAVKRMRVFGAEPKDHPEADVCSDPAHCQAWRSEEDAKKAWGAGAERNWSLISRAVDETNVLIIVYDGLVTDPVYHSTSGGPTENAEDVWGEEVPYLKSVPCDYCSHSPKLTQVVNIPLSNVYSAFKDGANVIPVGAGLFQTGIEVTEHTKSGRAKTVRIGGEVYKGTDVRKALGLNSTQFTVKTSGTTAVFEVKGYGHGVGMCQYGADGLARKGRNYLEIIKYYYQGVNVVPMFTE